MAEGGEQPFVIQTGTGRKESLMDDRKIRRGHMADIYRRISAGEYSTELW